MTMAEKAIWWIRRDLRLADNQALRSAIQSANQVIPVFIEDPHLWNSDKVGVKRLAFMIAGLRSLDNSLRSCGSYLVYRRGNPVDILPIMLQETGAGVIFAEEDYSPYARTRDGSVSDAAPLELTPGRTVHHPELVVKPNGTPYRVFTPFRRAWMSTPKPAPHSILTRPERIPTPQGVYTHPLPEMPGIRTFGAGEEQAFIRLRDFIDGEFPPVYRYAETRNRPDLNGTSGISPYLRLGMHSARQVVVAAFTSIDAAPDRDARHSAEAWLSEFIWREYYQSIIYHFPYVTRMSFRPEFRAIPWADDPSGLEAWKHGQTGYPLIDAAMRQLYQSGWMHNRNRMVVASFLSKNLLIDWREGERWFMQQLIDGDPASNNGGWQWSAGVGTDAAPYFRVFNPVKQSQSYDPDGNFIRQWVPELNNVPLKYIHEPWKMPKSVQSDVGCTIGLDYPSPIIDLEWSRQRVLSVFRQEMHAHR